MSGRTPSEHRRIHKHRLKASFLRRLRKRLWRQSFGASNIGHCYWCKQEILKEEATLDHEPPLGEGGHRSQAVIACQACNQKRSKELSIRIHKEMNIWRQTLKVGDIVLYCGEVYKIEKIYNEGVFLLGNDDTFCDRVYKRNLYKVERSSDGY